MAVDTPATLGWKLEDKGEVMWTLEEGLKYVRAWQQDAEFLGYHIAIGGGVLNNGSSLKDLDLYFLPLTNDKAPDVEGVLELIERTGYKYDPDLAPSHKPNPYTPFRFQGTLFETRSLSDRIGKRIDIFVV